MKIVGEDKNMILKFYGKALFICLVSLNFFACDKIKNGSADADVEANRSSQKTPFSHIENQNNQGQDVSNPLTKTDPPLDAMPDPNLQREQAAMPDSSSSVTIPDSSSKKVTNTPGNNGTLSKPESQIIIAPRDSAVSNDAEGVKTNPQGLTRNTEQTVKFAQPEFWNLSLEQVAKLDFLKGGSDIFYYYIQVVFNNVMSFVPQLKLSSLQESWNQFCYKSDCLKGIDIGQMNQSKLRSVIKNFSLTNSTVIYDETADQSVENVFFLQGGLAPSGWDRWRYIKSGNRVLPPHIKEIQKQLRIAEQKGVRRIAVNLPFQFHRDPVPFFLLGDFIKRNSIDLHIVGGCGHYCATYLIPAAKTVYIEPYGYIYYNASFLGLAMEIQKIFNIQKEKLNKQFKEEWLPGLTDQDRVDFLVRAMQPPVTSPKKLRDMIEFLKGNQVTSLKQEQKEEFNTKLKEFQTRPGNLSVTDWTDLELREFVQGFSSKLLEEIALLFKLEIDDAIQKGLIYLEQLADFSRMEGDYYSRRIHVDNLDSQKKYNYLDLTILFSRLLKDPEYEKFFSGPKLFYNEPEKKKPYEWIVPSSELLRSMGLDIRGENNIEMIDFSEFPLILGENKDIEGKVMFLDSLAIERCKFFSFTTPYNTKRLKECLADSMPKEAQALFQRSPFSLKEDMQTDRDTDSEEAIVTDSPVKADTLALSNPVLSKDFNFPQKKYWDLTLEQVASFDFIKKGGSDLFYYYLQAWFNGLNTVLEQTKLTASLRKILSGFCYKSDCSKGVDPKQIKEITIPSVIKYFSYSLPIEVYPNKEEDINPDAQPVYFLQGFLAPRGWNAWFQDDGSTNTAVHIQGISNTIYWMKQNKVQKIAVNLPPQLYEDPVPFFLLGKFIKKNKVDLHIVGGCGHYCVAYLIPAARTVYMEPYGYIMYHKVFMRDFFQRQIEL